MVRYETVVVIFKSKHRYKCTSRFNSHNDRPLWYTPMRKYSASEQRRQQLKRERRQREGAILQQINRPKTTSKPANDVTVAQRGVHRGREWYSK